MSVNTKRLEIFKFWLIRMNDEEVMSKEEIEEWINIENENMSKEEIEFMVETQKLVSYTMKKFETFEEFQKERLKYRSYRELLDELQKEFKESKVKLNLKEID